MTTLSYSQGFKRFVAFYATANAGAFIAFVPLLTLILPLKVAQIAPTQKLEMLSATLLAGAIMASVANIAAGTLSDIIYRRTNSRIGQIAVGLFLVLLSLFYFSLAGDMISLIGAILFFQLSFNLLFSPLGALLADRVPNSVKGRTAAFLNLGMPIATLFVAIVSIPLLQTESVRLLLIGAVATLAICPLLILGRYRDSRTNSAINVNVAAVGSQKQAIRRDFFWAWIARLLVQFSGAVMFGYMLYFLQDVVDYSSQFPGDRVDQGMGKLSLVATPVTIIMGILVGHLSDRLSLRRPFLIISAIAIGSAILCMSVWPSWPIVFSSYIFFIGGLTVFLTIDAALVAELLSEAENRARKLGLMNLTNTIPAIIAPAVALILHGANFETIALIGLIQIAGFFALCAAIAASRIRTVI